MRNRTPDFWPETLPPRAKPRVLMHVVDAYGVDSARICKMQCPRCGAETEWLEFRTVTEARRGIPCETCNPRVIDMNQRELIDAITNAARNDGRAALAKADVAVVLKLLGRFVGEALERDEVVEMPGLVKLKVKHRSERRGRNPQTGEAMTIEAKRVVEVSVLKALADRVGGTHAQA